jgi:hypothetical protein
MTAERPDDSPALGGRSDDNAPMISSVLTRVIVSARGAYLTGNLRALVRLMREPQVASFKHAIIQNLWDSINPVERILHLDVRIDELIEAASLVEQWLEHPTDTQINQIRQAMGTDAIDNYDSWLGDLLLATASTSIFDTCKLTITAALLDQDEFSGSNIALQSILKQWQLDTAWAILREQRVPPYPATDQQTLSYALTDLPRMYREKNFDALVQAFTLDQRHQFRHSILSVALNHLQKMLPRSPFQTIGQEWLRVMAKWLDKPAMPDAAAVERFNNTMRERYYRLYLDTTYRAFRELILAFEATRSTGLPFSAISFNDAMSHITVVVFNYHIVKSPRPLHDTALEPIWQRVRYRIEDWQLEAAWAILHDYPVPPLEPA